MNLISLHRFLEHMREIVKQRYASLYKKPQDEEREKEESETDREKTIQWNQLSSKLPHENKSNDQMSSHMQNEFYSRFAPNDMKLDNVMQNETIVVTIQALWEVWQLTGRDRRLFSQLMKNNFTNACTDRVRMMELSKTLSLPTKQQRWFGFVNLARRLLSH